MVKQVLHFFTILSTWDFQDGDESMFVTGLNEAAEDVKNEFPVPDLVSLMTTLKTALALA